MVLGLCGCGGMTETGSAMGTAGKPPPTAAAYSVVDLAPLSGTASYAQDINSGEEVVGYWIDAGSIRHAFRWTQAGGMVEILSDLTGQRYAMGINDPGDVVGGADFGAGRHAFLLPASAVALDLGTINGKAICTATAVNASGQVVGYACDTSLGNSLAFVGTASGIADMGTLLGGAEARALNVNDAGQVVGWSNLVGSAVHHGFLWQAGAVTDLGALAKPASAYRSEAYGLNNLANVQVVGSSQSGGGGVAFRWQNSAMSALQTLKGATGATAADTNDAGLVVGAWSDRNYAYRACLWQNGVAKDLNKLIDTSAGWTLVWANAVSDSGWIVGYGLKGGQTHGFALIPN
jgi:probable HAF family extracellular repeat protein